MGQSYRIRTEVGINKNINVLLDQDYEFLEVLSFKIQQTDIYDRSCAEYGVVVGRVTANNGFGIPNARVSVFIPIESVDESNPLITSIYPYKSPEDKNEDGFRYNLLPYEKSYSTHSATGTLPTRVDVLTDPLVVEIFDKYFKFTAKTNDSGDYMIMGVPTGTRKLIMDVDLSDIGEFSLTPQDLIRMGLATESQVAGNRFRTSNDLNSLPQIITIQKDIDVLPLWGDPDLCQLAICRTDFDLRDDANVDIQPTAVFMGSIFSAPDKFRLRPGVRIGNTVVGGCKPRDNMGNLCGLVAGPGQILAVRQTAAQDADGNPVLEQYQLEQAGNIIDGEGVWLTEVPMNLDYIITNEFGERVLSNDPSVGIPTKGKYRFKIKWAQAPTLTEQTRRAYFLVPNVREYGWNSSGSVDPNINVNSSQLVTEKKQLASSYYFGLAWSGYTNGFTGQAQINKLDEMINCEDTFYEMQFNRVYTVANLIDQWKKGARGRFIGIKEIDDDSCDSTINKFPVNDGFRNFDLLFFLFSILLTIISPTIIAVLVVAHIILFLYTLVIGFFCALCKIKIPVINVRPFGWLCRWFGIKCNKKDFTIRIPMMTYPECQACECKSDLKTTGQNPAIGPNGSTGGVLTYLSSPDTYITKFEEVFSASTDPTTEAILNAEALSGQGLLSVQSDPRVYKMPLSQNLKLDDRYYHISSKSLPLGERVNVFNGRKNYFDDINKIKVQVEPNLNIGKFHYDNTITVLSNQPFETGALLTTVNISNSQDVNWLFSANTADGIVTGISGTPYTSTAATTVSITYATALNSDLTVTYNVPYGTNDNNYRFPADIEYFQVVTAMTWSYASSKWDKNQTQTFGNVLTQPSISNVWRQDLFTLGRPYELIDNNSYVAIDYVEDLQEQYVLVLQRGVDPYSPKYIQKYQLGNLFGTGESDPNFTFTAATRLNIPIQKNSSVNNFVQDYSQAQMYHQSYFFNPLVSQFSAYTTVNTGYYSAQDRTYFNQGYFNDFGIFVVSKSSNGFQSSQTSSAKYGTQEDLSGVAGMGCNNYFTSIPLAYHSNNDYLPFFGYFYFTKTIYGNTSLNSTLTINNSTKNVLRTDRLPSSDQLDGGSWDINPALLQQNNNFGIYVIDTEDSDITSTAISTGAQQVTPDIEGLPNSVTVLSSFDCQNMVSLQCYTGFGGQFQINQNCVQKDAVERGCYMFMRRPLLDLFKDLGTFSEWSYRFRFFYGLCRGVLSQSFMNNWVNGTLYAFPIQIDTTYNRQNLPESRFCRDLIFYDTDTTNFYYRSSPYNYNTNKFVGKPTSSSAQPTNERNLLFPTTIVNLGMKDAFYQEISFEASTRAYIMTELETTSYGDTSDLINLFVISRITDASFLGQLLSAGDNSLNQLFSRPHLRIDGDLAQLMSINSEVGVVKFSPEYYDFDPNRTYNPTTILGTASQPVMAVWYSSTTQNIQTKDYLTPGRIDFRATPTSNFSPFLYGNKSQVVPFYRWQLNGGATIFGTQDNNWKTDRASILQSGYQSLDRMVLSNPTYFQSSTSPNTNDLFRRGYIFSVDANGNYSNVAALNQTFIVGAPFQFYFGTIKGKSALDNFKTKYSIVE